MPDDATNELPTTMRAAQVHALTGIDGIRLDDIAVPSPGAGEVLIRVENVGLSLADLIVAQGRYQSIPDLPFTIGMDLAGVVAAVGPGVRRTAVGDRVAATLHYGAAAEYAVAPETMTFPLPASTELAAAAAVPVNYLTAHFALHVRAQLRAGETVLVHGAAGGVGSAATQVARSLGARTIAVVSSDEKARFAEAHGADTTVRVDGFKDAVLEATDGRGVDVVVDVVGEAVILDSLRVLAPFGRHLVLGFAQGEPPSVKVNRLLLRNIDVRGVGWTGYVEADPENAWRQWDELYPMLESGGIAPAVGARYPLERIADALAEIQGRTSLGKIVLDVRG
ncbi:NADPH:quinone oxidoreductase family protein [Microbacterium sp. No. 7]|uniref:NADPH:quinone oxidoreductase family protein n=1 Tax=Microbacterium sp. No. 7 TaxID=1714373 RepID=UPI0006ED43A6|nr:NADPH:quinone oxidoreductase family protein [Microbacterium sp. No. 7]ALJ19273.1 NADPH:quinone oxidoreductase [Microbacterium sp. No. 7]